MGDDRSPNETYVQIAGVGHVMAADELAVGDRSVSPTLHMTFLRYAHTFMVQTWRRPPWPMAGPRSTSAWPAGC